MEENLHTTIVLCLMSVNYSAFHKILTNCFQSSFEIPKANYKLGNFIT